MLDRSVLTLFMTITGGMSWDEVFDALLQIHFGYAFLLVFFIAVMALAGLNIIAGIFVNDAIEMAQMDRDIVIQTETEKNRAMVKELVVLFEEFDTDKTGTLTLRELTEAWTNPEVSARFRILGVEHMDAAALFRTLDVDESEEIDIKEFVTGCLRARTLTRPVDFETFIRETRRTARRQHDQFKHVVSKLDRLPVEVRASEEHVAAMNLRKSKNSDFTRVAFHSHGLNLHADADVVDEPPLVFSGHVGPHAQSLSVQGPIRQSIQYT